MSDASDFLAKWVHKNITPTTAHIHNDTLAAGRLAEEYTCRAHSSPSTLRRNPKPEEVAAKLSTSSPLVRRRAGGGLLARRHL